MQRGLESEREMSNSAVVKSLPWKKKKRKKAKQSKK